MRPELVFHKRFQLLDHDQLFDFFGKFGNRRNGQRIAHADLENGNLRRGLAHILIARARAHHADA